MRERLSQAGLYRDIAAKTLMDDLVAYEPAYPLWADGATKRRWMRLPSGTRIDTSDAEHWRFPVGTQFFKEFSLDGVLLETRVIERVADTGNDQADYWMGAFVWRPDGSDAILAPDGATDVNGTAHDVPSQARCWSCHMGEPGHILGFSRLQLSKDDGVNVDWLADRRVVTVPSGRYAVPGDGAARNALGTLHANCGHCHSPNGVAWPDTQIILRLTGTERTVAETEIYRTTVGVLAQLPTHPAHALRILPGSPENSALFHRMGRRGDRDQMPPIATEIPDERGLAWVAAWIRSLPR
ncbi:MAG TPA: hypothetical protein VKE22_03745 [Haliangiales bacterium]|nr:hypothetical protein [Haliangiales bacterium]